MVRPIKREGVQIKIIGDLAITFQVSGVRFQLKPSLLLTPETGSIKEWHLPRQPTGTVKLVKEAYNGEL